MVIEKNKVVSITYELKTRKDASEEPSFAEKTDKENPLVFLFGAGNLLQAFESNLDGKSVGDNFKFELSSKDGYGEWREDHIAKIPIEAFKGEDGQIDREMIKVGSHLPMTDDKGNRLNGIVKESGLEHVTMDFNHPMAGQELHFSGEVVEVRDATEEEISHGHVHGPGGHQH